MFTCWARSQDFTRLLAACRLSAADLRLTGATAVLVVAMLICAIIGNLIERLCYRPLRDRPRLTVLITAIGVSLFIENAGQYVFGAEPKSFPEIISDRAIEIPESLRRTFRR